MTVQFPGPNIVNYFWREGDEDGRRKRGDDVRKWVPDAPCTPGSEIATGQVKSADLQKPGFGGMFLAALLMVCVGMW
jgi:hypothetical protein